MKDILSEIQPWIKAEEPFVLATVVRTWGSAPRKTGAHMAIHHSGGMIGSVSGGCVEGDVVKQAQIGLGEGRSQYVKYQVSDEEAWDVGLTCGGSVHILLEPFFTRGSSGSAEFWDKIDRAVGSDKGLVVAHRLQEVEGLPAVVSDGSSWHDEAVDALAKRAHRVIEDEEGEVFLEVVAPRSKLIMVGAAHVTVDLVALASEFGFETIVIDPRGFFVDRTQFPIPPDHLLHGWPEEVFDTLETDAYTYAVTLSHQPQIDDQALRHLLRSEVAYTGALGSRRSHAKRTARLREAGFTEDEIARIRAPVGLAINAQSAREIALSIMAQIIEVKNQYL